jgi:hypothetical protein
MKKRLKILTALVIVFTGEKMLQHILMAIFFAVQIPGIGTPDIGPYFSIDNHTMAVLNLLYFILMGTGLFGMVRQLGWGILLIIILAVLDILLEFLFHGLFYITVSVIASTILTIASVWYLKERKYRD